jgi:hypothetical protein
MDPASATYRKLERRIAAASLREALFCLRRVGTVADLREAAFAVAAIVARRNAGKGGK